MRKFPKIEICSAAEVTKKLRASRMLPWRAPISTVLSIENPGYNSKKNHHSADKLIKKYGFAPRVHGHNDVQQTILQFHDTYAHDASTPATAQHLSTIIHVARHHIERAPDSVLLIHCIKGRARSPAAGLAILAGFDKIRNNVCDPEGWINKLLVIRPTAAPDPHLVAMTDSDLGLKGHLIEAVNRDKRLIQNRRDHALKLYGYIPSGM